MRESPMRHSPARRSPPRHSPTRRPPPPPHTDDAPLITVICSNFQNPASDLNNGGLRLLLQQFPDCNVTTIEGEFPHVMDNVDKDSVICFMGCNQLAMLFDFSVGQILDKLSKTEIKSRVNLCLHKLGDRWFFFVEKNREDPPRTPLTVHSMSKMSRSNYVDLEAKPLQKVMHRVNQYISHYASKQLHKRRMKNGAVMYRRK